MLRNAVVLVASRRAEMVDLECPGQLQEIRDRKYQEAFFGADFIAELETLDSEFLHTGNKLLSLHSMDSTSLASALFLMSLAKNDVRMEILEVFDRMVTADLPQAEFEYLQAAGGPKIYGCKEKKFPYLAPNARFASFKGFFDAELHGAETMTPLQREFVRLAQIFKSQLVTEIELRQRVMQRALIEERIQCDPAFPICHKERDAEVALEAAQKAIYEQHKQVVVAMTRMSAQFDGIADSVRQMQLYWDSTLAEPVRHIRNQDPCGSLTLGNVKVEYSFDSATNRLEVGKKSKDSQEKQKQVWIHTYRRSLSLMSNAFAELRAYRFTEHNHDFRKALDLAKDVFKSGYDTGEIEKDAFNPCRLQDAADLAELIVRLGEVVQQRGAQLRQSVRVFTAELADPEINVALVLMRWVKLRKSILESLWLRNAPEDSTAVMLRDDFIRPVDEGFDKLMTADFERQLAVYNAANARRPLDHKKFLDMLVDDVEEKYIELVEGTRAHTANIDNYLQRLATALEDDFNTQFYHPTFRHVRETSQYWDVTFGQVETTTVLTNNRMFAKVEPQATMEFDLPKRDILINEAFRSAYAAYSDYGALLQDPTFLALSKLYSGQPTSTPYNTGMPHPLVRNVLPGLPSSTDEALLIQAEGGPPKFGSQLEALIPDPAIYKFETGTGFEIRPVIQPDGQAVVFHLNYMYTTNVREPVRPDEKHLGRVKRHFIDTDVQTGNYELREVSRYQVALKAARKSRGVPLLEDVPGVGVLFRPLPQAESSLQENIILAQSVIYPTMFDLMGLRWAPAVADLDALRLQELDFVTRGRERTLQNRVFDHSSHQVDEFLRVPQAERRPDLYRTQESIPFVHPNGYSGPGLNMRDSHLQEGYDPRMIHPETPYVPGQSKEGVPLQPYYGVPHTQGPHTHVPRIEGSGSVFEENSRLPNIEHAPAPSPVQRDSDSGALDFGPQKPSQSTILVPNQGTTRIVPLQRNGQRATPPVSDTPRPTLAPPTKGSDRHQRPIDDVESGQPVETGKRGALRWPFQKRTTSAGTIKSAHGAAVDIIPTHHEQPASPSKSDSNSKASGWRLPLFQRR